MDDQGGPAENRTRFAPEPEDLEAVREGEAEVEALLAQFPADEWLLVARGLYFDAEGRAKTRHGMLRPTT